MPATASNQSLIDELRAAHPISGLLHVGAGAGSLERYRSWSVRDLVLVEADEERYELLSREIEGYPRWLSYCAVLAEGRSAVPFHVANNLNESGLVEPEVLRPLWQNLQTVAGQRRETMSIEEFLRSNIEPWAAGRLNWVNIDCLPALSILRGAGDYLSQWNVVMARAVLDEALLSDRVEIGREALDAFMVARGFLSVGLEPERHPGIGKIVYLRDLAAEPGRRAHDVQSGPEEQPQEANQPAESEPEEQSARCAQAAGPSPEEIARLREERDNYRNQAERHRNEADDLSKERQLNKLELEILRSKVDELTSERDELNKKAEQLRAQVANQEQRERQLQARVEALKGEIEQSMRETRGERTQLEDELKKAEMQMALLKDVLLKRLEP